MEAVTLPLDFWLLCRVTRPSDNSLAALAMASLVQSLGKLNVWFVCFSRGRRPGQRHSTGRNVDTPPLTLIHSLVLGKSTSCSLSPRSYGCRRHKGDKDPVCAALQPPREGMSQRQGDGDGDGREEQIELSWVVAAGCWVAESKVGYRWVNPVERGMETALLWFKKRYQPTHPFLAD